MQFIHKNRLVGTVSILRMMLALVLLVTTMGLAQGGKEKELVTDFMKVYSFATDKISQLAEEFPADKYNWRPAEGVRSVHETFMHVAGGNYYMASLMGTPIPEGINPRNLEKMQVDKAKCISTFKQSVDHVKAAIKNLKPEAFDQEVEFFNMTGTKRQIVFMVGDHAAEHLGQLIAYARMNGIVPPWSGSGN